MPDLAVEVVSRSNSGPDLVEKAEDYFQAGVRLLWMIYPKQGVVQVYESAQAMRVLRREDTLDGGDVLPGFRLPLTTLFRS